MTSFAANASAEPTCPQVDSYGNVLVAGDTTGSFTGYTNAGNSDMILLNLSSSDGSSQWIAQRGGISYDGGYAVKALVLEGLGVDVALVFVLSYRYGMS